MDYCIFAGSANVCVNLSSPQQCEGDGSGVPQGSVLGSLLFLVYVDEVPKDLSANFKIFADDLKIYFRVADMTTQV